MSNREKKLAAALAAVRLYVQQDEEAAAAAAAETRRTGTLRVDALADAVLGHLLSDVLGEP